MRSLVMTLIVGVALAGCGGPKLVLRQKAVYQAELDQYHNWAIGQAKHLRAFISENCECGGPPEGDPFQTADCEQAADFVLTIEARAEWHKQMSLWNAGMLEQEPAAQPPEIAQLSCPLPPAPGGE